MKTNFNKKNLGCRKSVSSSISWFFKFEKDGIILEDDCLPSQSFFTFCEELLNYYKDNKKIMHISGDNFSPNFLDKSSYFFTKIQHCWGWATWSDRWKYYGKNLKNFYSKDLVKFSDEINIQKYWRNILQRMNNDEIDSWAYQWAFKIVKRNGLCINPTVNLISNIGFSKDGSHTVDSNNPYANLPTFNIKKIVHPNKVVLDKKAVKYIYENHYGIKNI